MRAPLLLLLSAICAVRAAGATYYVSLAGSDASDGRSPARPWRSIARVSSAALSPGDTVLFRRGDVFTGEISTESGSAAAPIVFGAYGAGNAPVISGAVRIPTTGWRVLRGAVLARDSVTIRSMFDGEPPELFFNGALLLPARHPNEGFLTADAVEGINPGSHCCEYSTAFIAAALGAAFPSAEDLRGGHVTAYDPYGVATSRIRAWDPSTGRAAIDSLHGASFQVYRSFFLSCRPALLDAPGEWYYDETARRLQLWFPGSALPTDADTLLASSASFGFNLWQVSHIVIEDLEFRHQQIAGVWAIRSDGVALRRCRFSGMKHGVYAWGSDGPPERTVTDLVVEDCSFEGTLRTGVTARNLLGASIARNTFTGIGMVDAIGQSGAGDQWNGYGNYEYGIGVQASGRNSSVRGNVFRLTGRQAIAAGGPGVRIAENIIDRPCERYNDCGGIMPLGASLVERNLITNSLGRFTEHRSMGPRGVYPDFRSGDTIRGNTIVNTVLGIGLTNAKDEVVEDNTVYGASMIGFRMNKKTPGALSNTVRRNVLFGLDAAGYSLHWENMVSDADASTLDSNAYWNPYLPFPTIRFRRDSASGEALYDLAGWQGTGHDRGSRAEFVSFASPWTPFDTTGPNLVANPAFDAGAAGWSYPDSMTVVDGVLDGPCLRMKKNSTGNKTLSTALTAPLDTARLYLVAFDAMDPSNIGRVEPRVREQGGSGRVSFDRYYLTKRTRRHSWCVFRPAVNGAARLEFLSSNSQWWLDNVVVVPVDARYRDPRAVFPIFVNPTSGIITADPGPGRWLDLDSAVVEGPFRLAPWSSRILVAVDTAGGSSSAADPCGASSTPLPRLRVYPNPSTGTGLHVDADGIPHTGATVTLRDALGRVLANTAVAAAGGRAHCRFAQRLPPGMYCVMLSTAASQSSRIVVVLR